METALLIGGIIIAFVVGLYFLPKIFGGSKKKARNDSSSVKTVLDGVPKDFQFDYQTPLKLNIGSTVEIPADVQAEVFRAHEIGVINRIRTTRAKFPHWQNKMDESNLSHTYIGLIEPHASNMDGSPALLVQGTQTAGTVIGLKNVTGGADYPVQLIVLPHQANTNWTHLNYLAHTVRNESEHDAEFANDVSEAMKYTGAGDSHPHHRFENPADELLVSNSTGGQGFMSKAKPKCYFPRPE